MSATKCFPNLHMTMAEHSLWEVCRSISHANNYVLRFDGRYLASLYKGSSKSAIYRTVEGLIKAGWFAVIKQKQKDPASGKWLSAIYRVLSTDEWANLHPHDCAPVPQVKLDFPVPQAGQGEAIPKYGTGHHSQVRDRNQSQKTKNQSQKVPKPVPSTGHSSDVYSEGNSYPPPPDTKKKAGAAGYFSKCYEEKTGNPPGIPLTETQRDQLYELATKNRKERFNKVCRLWCEKRDLNNLKFAFGTFIKEFDQFLEPVLAEERNERNNAEMIQRLRADGKRENEARSAKRAEEKALAAKTVGVI